MIKKFMNAWLRILTFLLGLLILIWILFKGNLFRFQNSVISLQSLQTSKILRGASQQISLPDISAVTFTIAPDQSYWIGGKTRLIHLTEQGSFLENIAVKEPVNAIAAYSNQIIFAATDKQIISYSPDSSKWKETRFPPLEGRPYITSLCVSGDQLYVADAGNKQLHAYDLEGKILWSSSGRDKFIVPSPYFDVVPDSQGGVWVVNPGYHRIENYDRYGNYVALWEPSKKNKFLGCCNPAHLAIFPGDRFVTLEKGLIQCRIFSPAGDVERIVARKQQLYNSGKMSFDSSISTEFAYELALKKDGSIVILDIDENILHIFKSSDAALIAKEEEAQP